MHHSIPHGTFAQIASRAASGPTELTMTCHCARRMAARNISPLAVLAAVRFGTAVHQRGEGCTTYALYRKDLPPSLHHDVADRIVGTCVVVSSDGHLLTAYRAPQARPIDLRRRPVRTRPDRKDWRARRRHAVRTEVPIAR